MAEIVNTEGPPARVHVWSQVGFAHLRAHRCGVYVHPELDDNEALCHETPVWRAELVATAPYGSPVTALCATHGKAARTWPIVERLTSFRELAPVGEA